MPAFESPEMPMSRDESSPDELVMISRWELDALRSGASATSPRPTPEGPTTPAEPEAPRVDSGAKDRRADDLERAYKAAVRDRELATALAGRPLVPGAAAQLIKLWRDDFDVHEADGELRVSARDGRPVAKAVAERLAEAEYAHFCPPASRGGAAIKAPHRPGSPGPTAPPRNLGDAVLQSWRETSAMRSDPATRPIGLRRR